VSRAEPADLPLIQNPWQRALVILGVWTFLAVFFIGQDLTAHTAYNRDEPLNLTRTVGYELIYWYVWAALSLPVIWLARRYRMAGEDRGTRPASRPHLQRQCVARRVAQHSFFAVWFAAAHTLLTFAVATAAFGVRQMSSGPLTFELFMRTGFPVELFTGFYKYWLIVMIYWTLDYSRKYRERELRAAQLETQLANAQLQALKMQLHPHFLFNTLHAVSMLNFTDVDASNRMLVQLSDLLRITLENSGNQEVRLRNELDFLRRYLEIEQTRFHDRLSVEIDADPRLLDAYVPNLILQPLVENAIRHGVGKLARPGHVRVRAMRNGNDLILEVRDDGTGLPDSWDLESDGGIGLSNTRARLTQLYGTRQSFELSPLATGGVLARILMPLRFAARGAEVFA
jgi:two-component system, LytTR family, sensor kinase